MLIGSVTLLKAFTKAYTEAYTDVYASQDRQKAPKIAKKRTLIAHSIVNNSSRIDIRYDLESSKYGLSKSVLQWIVSCTLVKIASVKYAEFVKKHLVYVMISFQIFI